MIPVPLIDKSNRIIKLVKNLKGNSAEINNLKREVLGLEQIIKDYDFSEYVSLEEIESSAKMIENGLLEDMMNKAKTVKQWQIILMGLNDLQDDLYYDPFYIHLGKLLSKVDDKVSLNNPDIINLLLMLVKAALNSNSLVLFNYLDDYYTDEDIKYVLQNTDKANELRYLLSL